MRTNIKKKKSMCDYIFSYVAVFFNFVNFKTMHSHKQLLKFLYLKLLLIPKMLLSTIFVYALINKLKH